MCGNPTAIHRSGRPMPLVLIESHEQGTPWQVTDEGSDVYAPLHLAFNAWRLGLLIGVEYFRPFGGKPRQDAAQFPFLGTIPQNERCPWVNRCFPQQGVSLSPRY